ncbi:hypothetical protein BpHYR1_051492 [Brachionus plicatilis]|uniref:Uncharacterized protein n=1 Tax=Brachionus plicatilis TaxID=10195 RepID=A0A3M7PD94_BRAPC|nr:hypothetical protein BpHYR1_051492 [Brachionus plicatilis]
MGTSLLINLESLKLKLITSGLAFHEFTSELFKSPKKKSKLHIKKFIYSWVFQCNKFAKNQNFLEFFLDLDFT